MNEDGILRLVQKICGDGVWLVECVGIGKLVKCFTTSRIKSLGEIVFRESTSNNFKSMVNYVRHKMGAIVQIDKYLTLENNSLAIGEILVTILWVLVSQVRVNDSAWAIYTKYRKDVRVLFERDSEDEVVKSGVVSEDSVKLNESIAISFIKYDKGVKAAEKSSNDKSICIESNEPFRLEYQDFKFFRTNSHVKFVFFNQIF